LKPDKYKKNYFYEAGRDEETAKSTAELRRLLYVGMTRAESELYITGTLACVQDVWKTINEDTDAGEIIRRVYESKLKRQEKKIEDGELRIQGGDTIIHDDTFFGLLLPSLAHIGPGRYFSCERIQESPPAPQKTGIPNTGDGRASFLRAAEAAYHHAAVLEKPPPRYLRAAVSALSGLPLPDGLCFTAAEEFSGEPAAAVFETIDTLFGRPPSAGIAGDDEGVLGAAALGTLVHRALEARLKNEEFAMPPQFAALLVEAEEKAETAACADIAETFLNGPLGRRAAAARRRESELPFRMNVPPPLAAATPLLSPDATIDGVIDLVFETDNTIYIVDFKTGRLEMPEQYGWQMLLYRQAAINLWGKDSSPFLYYLRSGCAYRLNALLPKNPPDRSVRVRYGDIP
ncbi:MAG: PD-(D/E)XK nuclease family protein, partial [Spirochaetaceae bacterium]|nr:PD-(D/E)XK nuclease family protein [Spirochaetaceae bacterium]